MDRTQFLQPPFFEIYLRTSREDSVCTTLCSDNALLSLHGSGVYKFPSVGIETNLFKSVR